VYLTVTLPSKEQPGLGLVTLIDITERKRSVAERDQLVRELGAAVHARDDFLSVASHELKTPLTPLRLKLDVLARDAIALPQDPLAQKVLRTVEAGRRQLDKLSTLIGDLLDVSRIAAGRFTVHKEPADLVSITKEVVVRYEAAAAEAGCALELQSPQSANGVWDKLKLEQVVTNLVDNAIKYGQGKPILISIQNRPEGVELSVKDHGIGISPEAMNRIFGRFERAVSERHYGGLGLGLYISQTIVEAMGGHIRVDSAPEEGARFEVVLPRVAA
jgi:signal transduction histidine kinase